MLTIALWKTVTGVKIKDKKKDLLKLKKLIFMEKKFH